MAKLEIKTDRKGNLHIRSDASLEATFQDGETDRQWSITRADADDMLTKARILISGSDQKCTLVQTGTSTKRNKIEVTQAGSNNKLMIKQS